MNLYKIFINGEPLRTELTRTGENRFTVKVDDKVFTAELPVDEIDFEKPFSIKISDKTYRVEFYKFKQKQFPVKVEDVTFRVEVKTPKRQASAVVKPVNMTPRRGTAMSTQHVDGAVIAPMTGKIVSVKAKKGDQVKTGQTLCVLEAMKMENEIAAPESGTVQEVYVSEGSSVSEGKVLFMVS